MHESSPLPSAGSVRAGLRTTSKLLCSAAPALVAALQIAACNATHQRGSEFLVSVGSTDSKVCETKQDCASKPAECKPAQKPACKQVCSCKASCGTCSQSCRWLPATWRPAAERVPVCPTGCKSMSSVYDEEAPPVRVATKASLKLDRVWSGPPPQAADHSTTITLSGSESPGRLCTELLACMQHASGTGSTSWLACRDTTACKACASQLCMHSPTGTKGRPLPGWASGARRCSLCRSPAVRPWLLVPCCKLLQAQQRTVLKRHGSSDSDDMPIQAKRARALAQHPLPQQASTSLLPLCMTMAAPSPNDCRT